MEGEKMKILILDDLSGGTDKHEASLKALGHQVVKFQLRTMNIHDCIGCYDCWLKTPGVCIFKDDNVKVLSEYVKSDLVILASDVKIGFVTPQIKRIRDRSLPLIHPFLMLKGDRMAHLPRYDKLPKQILMLSRSQALDDESIETINAVYGIPKNEEIIQCFDDCNIEEVLSEIISH